MRRRILNALTLFSLLLFLAVSSISIRSYSVEDRLLRRRSDLRLQAIQSRWGHLSVEFASPAGPTTTPHRWHYESVSVFQSYAPVLMQEEQWSFLGIRSYRKAARSLRPGSTFYVVPYWPAVLIVALLPLSRLLIWQAHARRLKRRGFPVQ